MEALTDAYLDPDIGMRKAEYAHLWREIEKEISERKREAAKLQAQMEMKAISHQQMQAAEQFAAEVRKGIDLLAFEEKQKVLQLLGIQGTVRVEDDERVSVRVEGLFPETRVEVSSKASGRCGQYPNSSGASFSLVVRL